MKIQASGRVISSINASRLKGLFSEIGSILVDAKVLDTDSLKRILDDELGELAEELEEGERAEIEAGCLGEMIKRNSFHVIINQALDSFRFCLGDLVHISDERLKKEYGNEKTRLNMALEMVDDLAIFLKEQVTKLPEPMDLGYPFNYPVYASAKSTTEVIDSVEPKDFIEAEAFADSESYQETSLTFNFELSEDIQASATIEAQGNKMPIHGVLFLIDEVSEFPPSKGSDYPLYVPRAIAEIAAEAINSSGGLPLDADNSLKKHANQDIVGIMTSATISGNEFWVSGHLFPWNNKEKVSLISANSKTLGMSMNAHARTHHEVINGVRVSCVDKLEILGANILYADKATYQKTKVQVPSGNLIAASQQQNTTETNMDHKQQFESIHSMLSELIAESKSNSAKLTSVENKVDSHDKVIAEIQAERAERLNTVQAQLRAEEDKNKQEQLIQAVGEIIANNNKELEEKILASVGAAANRRGQQPPRRAGGLVDVVQAGATPALSGLQLELRDAETSLRTLREAGITGPERARLIERISSLKQQISNS